MGKVRAIVAALLFAACIPLEAAWFKGNTHTHTLESDGDSTPAEVVRWYADHGYHFLVITDHDRITRLESEALLLIPGEEVTDRLSGKSLHTNGLGLQRVVKPQGGTTPVEVLQRDIDAIREAGGIAAINHPNFGWAFGAKELLQLEKATLLEIASGHPYVNMQGPPTVESMWDELLTAGKRIYGIAVDDSHHLKRPWDTDVAPPGKAWIVVRAERLEEKAILGALANGEFYASTGVEIAEYSVDAAKMRVTVREKNLARYTIQFIGDGGRVLQSSMGTDARYTFTGQEQYVRAKVMDSNGKAAWLQPTFARSRSSSR
jgi:hypothetical protein